MGAGKWFVEKKKSMYVEAKFGERKLQRVKKLIQEKDTKTTEKRQIDSIERMLISGRETIKKSFLREKCEENK